MKTLEQHVDSIISSIVKEECSRYRCHEISRALRDGLLNLGYENVLVRDGMIRYDTNFLKEMMIESMSTDDELVNKSLEKVFDDCKNKLTKYHIHSWCEVGDTVADYNPTIEIAPSFSLFRLKIVKKKKELSGKIYYYPTGREVNINGNTFLYIPLFYFTKVRT